MSAAEPTKQDKTPSNTQPQKPKVQFYWRNATEVDQGVKGPDGVHRTIPPKILVHEDQFEDPRVLEKMRAIFVKVPKIEVAKSEASKRLLVVGGPHNTAKGHYVPTN